MAARRASMRLYKTAQTQSACIFRPEGPALAQSNAVSQQAAVATFVRSDIWSNGFERGFFDRTIFARQLHSEGQARVDGEETHEYENSKMTAEGGGHAEKSFHEKVSEVKERTMGGNLKEAMGGASEKADEVKDKAGSVTDSVADQASKEAGVAKDMFKDFPQKVSETATGLKEVGVEAGKAVKRDAAKVAEKVGLKSE